MRKKRQSCLGPRHCPFPFPRPVCLLEDLEEPLENEQICICVLKKHRRAKSCVIPCRSCPRPSHCLGQFVHSQQVHFAKMPF